MKKIIFIFIMVIGIPYLVLADAGSPSILGYDAVIINKNGAKTTDGEKKFKYNTKIHVVNEYDGEVYACDYGKKDCGGDYTLSIKDVAPLKNEVLPKDLIKINNQGTTLEESKDKIYIMEKKGVKLKKGPADIYGEYDIVIPFKKELKTTYYISSFSPEGGSSWYYVDDGDYKGWIDDKYAIYINSSMMVFDDVKMYNIDTDEVIATIPVGTIIDKYYSYGGQSLLTYKDEFGYINNLYKSGDDYYYTVGYTSNGYILTIDNIDVKSNGKTISAIPKAKLVRVLYGYDDTSEHGTHKTNPICTKENNCLYYVDYNGIKGFVENRNIVPMYVYYESESTVIQEESILYKYDLYEDEWWKEGVKLDSYIEKYKTSVKVPAYTKVDLYMTESMSEYDSNVRYEIKLIKYNNNVGWVITDIENEYQEEPTNSPIPNKNKDNKQENNITNIIVYSIIGAVVLSLTAFVTIKLINKKKKKNIEVPKKEEKDIKKEKKPEEVKEEKSNKEAEKKIKK